VAERTHQVCRGTDSSLLVALASVPARDSTDGSRPACHTPWLEAEPATQMDMHRREPRVVFVDTACDRHSWQAWNEHVRDGLVALEQDEAAKAPRESSQEVPAAGEWTR
jgi:hypothetical protein